MLGEGPGDTARRMTARALGLVSAVLFVACVRSSSVPCGDQGVCREGTVCAQVHEPDELLCVTPQQLEACESPAADGSCALAGVESARCYDGVCLPGGCGNLRKDPGEVCDDGNDRPGDGCSAECRSNETCGNGVADAVKGELCDDGNATSHDGCDGTCRPELPRWNDVDGVQPSPRQGAAMAYDARRKVVVMFGGIEDDSATPNVFGETWIWDGLGWVNAAPLTSPSSRGWAAMAYDASRDRVVLFGGGSAVTANEDVVAETWEWDGAAWSLRPVTNPPPGRSHHVMAYDAKRKRVVMYGGIGGGGELADTWEWDGTAWTQVMGGAPPARRGGVLAFDPVRGASILFGGQTGLTELGDTWTFDGAWTPITTTMQPVARHDAGLAFDVVAGKLVLFGGINVTAQSAEVWTFEGSGWAPRATQSAPLARSGHAMAFDIERGNLVVFGGKAVDFSIPGRVPFCIADTYGLAATTWTRLDAATPPLSARYLHAAAYDSLRRRAVIFGGTDGSTLGDTWEVRDDRAVRIAASGPSKRHSAAAAFDEANKRTILFGGTDSAALADTWAWSGTSWSNVTPGTSPTARSGHAMAYDASRSRVVLFGGTGAGGASRETWEWNGAQWSNVTPATGPSARQQAALAYDPIAKRIVLFGGRSGTGAVLDDTWLWDGTAWTPAQPTVVPPRRARGAMAWDPSRRRVVLVGGQASTATALNDAWEWNGTTWTAVMAPDVPTPRYGLALLPASDGAGVVAIGGAEITPAGVTKPADIRAWHLVWSGTTTGEQCQTGRDTDGDGLTGCADPDCGFLCAHCGDGQCAAGVESCSLCPMDCGTCTPACGNFSCEMSETAAACPGDC